jgi:hypothetical protein
VHATQDLGAARQATDGNEGMLRDEGRWMRSMAGCDRIVSALGYAHLEDHSYALLTQYASAGDLERHIIPRRCAAPCSGAPALLPCTCTLIAPRLLFWRAPVRRRGIWTTVRSVSALLWGLLGF